MSTELKSQVIPASGELVISATANFFFLISATVNVNVRFQRGGTSFGANGIQAGYVKGVVNHWDRAVVAGTAGATVSYFIGTEELREDITDFRQQIATIAGIVQMAEQPAASVANTVAVSRLTATQGALFAANLSRRRVTVYVDSTNVPSAAGVNCFIRTIGGANNIGELVPGLNYPFVGTYGLEVRNDTGNTWVFYIFEES